jgi:hypothetical protein
VEVVGGDGGRRLARVANRCLAHRQVSDAEVLGHGEGSDGQHGEHGRDEEEEEYGGVGHGYRASFRGFSILMTCVSSDV